jgi:hypothetical protein
MTNGEAARGHTAEVFSDRATAAQAGALPQQRRLRLDTVSLRGLFNQQIHGSKRSLHSVEDFTEFE